MNGSVPPRYLMRGVRGHRQDGSATVEVATLFPVVFLLMLVMLQIGFDRHAAQAAAAAAQEGARSAAAYLGSDDAGYDAAWAVLSNLATDDLRGAEVTVVRNNSAQSVTVTVRGNVKSLVPGWSPKVTKTATSPVERLSP